MPFAALQMNPGVDVEKTALLNSASWSQSVGIRFFEGLPQKVGGWQALNNSTPLIGICTGMHAWADLAGNPYIAAGTDQRLELFYGGAIQDITPIRKTVDITPAFETTNGDETVKVTDVAHGAFEGDWIDIVIPVSIGGIILQGLYQITNVVDADNYKIEAANEATSNDSGGAVPEFTTLNTDPNVTVTLNDHGLISGDLFEVQVEVIVGGITITVGSYNVTASSTDTFVIVPAGAASSDDDVFENSGDARIEYLVHSGLSNATYSDTSGVYGAGVYGGGIYGGSNGQAVLLPLRQWFLDNFGQDLVGNYTGSPIFMWAPPPASGNVALAIDTTNFPSSISPPQEVMVSFVSAPQQQIIALGCDDGFSHVFDPLLVRWCDSSNFLDWIATTTNQAGSYRIPTGSKLVGGIRAPNFIALWTDVDMWLMSYIGAGLVWGFNQVATGVNLLCARGVIVFRNVVYWVASNGFYAFDGNSVVQIPCPVWDKFWYNLDRMQVDKVNAQANSWFQEVSWSYPSTVTRGERGLELVNARITYNIREGVWTYDEVPQQVARTAWIDANVYGPPIGTTNMGLMMQHEMGNDANGAALISSVQTGWFSASEGSYLTMLERLSIDAIATGGTQTLQVTVYTQNYPSGPITTYGPYPYTPGTQPGDANAGPPYSIVRARGRFISIKLSSSDKGVFWRLGRIRYVVNQAGRTP